MRLISIHLRNYRVHRDLAVTFDPSRNLIGGPNESGKSTLAEAIHRALFLRAKTGGALQKNMVSTHPGDPEVTLRFEAAGISWELEKRFAGASRGSTRLTGDGQATLKDDEADARLTQILGTESGGRTNATQLAATWAHLWVWQGSSGEDPALHASSHKDTLVQRLQQDGIAAVMQSATDQAVREHVAATYDSLFTATGKPKANSPAELARTRLATAEETLLRARDLADKLDQAADNHTRANAEISAAKTILPTLVTSREATVQKLSQVADLRRLEDARRIAFETAISARDQLAKDHQRILTLHQQATTAADALTPAEEKQSALTAGESTARAASQSLAEIHRDATAAVRQTRCQHDLALAVLSAFEKSESHQRLITRVNEADEVRVQLTTARTHLSQLPPLTSGDLTSLRKLDRNASHATAALDAMATGIELLASDQPVTLDGKPLQPGASTILTDAGEIAIGSGTRLRIRPGGGSSLEAARATAGSSRSAFADALTRLGLRDLDHATSVLEQRGEAEQQIARLEARWKALGGDSLATELATAAAALDTARAEVRRREALVENPDAAPVDFASATARLARCQENLTRAEAAENSSRRETEKAASALEAAIVAAQTHKSRIADAIQSLRDLRTRVAVLEESHGETTTRLSKLSQATEAVQSAERDLSSTREELAKLEPDALTADLDRFDRAIAQQESRLRDAENQRLVAQAQLTLDGSSDPRAELSHAAARCDSARETFATEQRRAAAIATLHELFSTTREAIDRSLVQPLADRIAGYLACLFGAGSGVSLDLSDGGIGGLNLIRSGGSAFSFAALSGGAREQVAAAARLAMAEILASDHGGCLPVVFDDAFAYTDPDRVLRLQRMLDLAAVRGLQIIVLTCTPDDYSAFGATRIPLTDRPS